MKETKRYLVLAPLVGAAALAACTSTSSTPAVACGPDNVATTNWDVVAVNNYEAAWYYAAVDPIPTAYYAFETPVGGSDPDGGDAAAADGSVDASMDASMDASVGADGGSAEGGGPVSSALVASSAAGAVGQYFPNGCATATANANVVTYKLNNCTGPIGLAGASGTVTATFTAFTGSVQVQLSGNNVSVNGATINLSTSGTATLNNGQKTLQATTQSTGTGPYGNSAMHTGMYTVVWPTGMGCATINGTFSGVGTGTYAGTSTQIMNYVACTNKCPQSGTATSSFNGGTATLTFNGTNNAQCAASNGTSASVPIRCP
ncbi:MAG TPA: hypothetical protein VE987_04855 [Polyangiaceae bacterium]|nr:hypothetical protein [Polyangiaceae bacterium]